MTNEEGSAQKKMAAKVAKLLRLAEHPNTPEHERLSASASAAALMEKFAIDEFLVSQAGGEQVQDELIKKAYYYDGVYNVVNTQLVWRLAEAMGLKSIRTKLGGSKVRMDVVGWKRDFERYDTLLASGLIQLAAATNVYIAGLQGRGWQYLSASEKYNAKRSFGMGFANGFGEKVAESHRRVETEAVAEHGASTELVLVDRKKQVEVHYARLFPGARTGRSLKITGSYSAGQAAGRAAGGTNTSLGGSRRAIR